MTRQPNDLKKRTGAELRAQAAERAAAAADPVEQARRVLANHEHVIESARRSFVDMGRSLLAIRTERLYAGEYSTFADYCDARWDISEAYANRVITAALVAIKATPIGVEINSEAQARELSDLADEPEQLRQVWDEATRRAAGGRVTAALIKEVRRSLDPPPADALDGEIVDDLDKFPDAKAAIDASLASRNAPAEQPEEDHRAAPGDAAQDEVPVVPAESLGDETGPEVLAPRPASEPVELPQEQVTAGVSVPAPAGDPERSGGNEERGQAADPVPAPPRTGETDEERAEREVREYREARSLEFATGLVNVRMRLEPDPVHWYQNVYIPGLYHARNLPRVKDSFTPTGLRQAAGFLLELADHLDEAGEEL